MCQENRIKEKTRPVCLVLCIWLVIFLHFRKILNEEAKTTLVPLIYCLSMDKHYFFMSKVGPCNVLALSVE